MAMLPAREELKLYPTKGQRIPLWAIFKGVYVAVVHMSEPLASRIYQNVPKQLK